MANKRLLFVHDRLPAEGISGMIIFLRHFKRMSDYDIHILVPESANHQMVVNSYPPNFIVHTFRNRENWWPPFRERSPLLVKIRLLLLRRKFYLKIKEINPEITLSVLYHYYSVAVAQSCKSLRKPFFIFLHDAWDLKSSELNAQNLRKKYGQKVIAESTYIFSVTNELITNYVPTAPNNSEVLFPVPEGLRMQESFSDKKTILYAGTIEGHHLSFFELILPVLKNNHYSLLVVTNETEKLSELATSNSNLDIQSSFQSNVDALNFIHKNASAILVNYGLSQQENPFAFHSFPSKFIEFVYLNLPIICIAPLNSPFYNFLKELNWSLLLEKQIVDELQTMLLKLNIEAQYQAFCNESSTLAIGIFNHEKIHQRFQNLITKFAEYDNVK